MKNILSLVLVIGMSFSSNAQLADGSIAPDFTLTDLDGTQHRLYDYLDEGKVVFLEMFACHCPSCWAYHNSGKLESLYQSYGPAGTDQVQVFMVEHDPNNTMDHFLGNHWYTQGDWLTGNSIPVFNPEGLDRQIFIDYNLTSYPIVYKICPDKILTRMSTAASVADLYQSADECPGTLDISTDEIGEINIDIVNHQLILENFDKIEDVSIVNSIGQTVQVESSEEGTNYDLSSLEAGLYFIAIKHSKGTTIKKVYLQ